MLLDSLKVLPISYMNEVNNKYLLMYKFCRT